MTVSVTVSAGFSAFSVVVSGSAFSVVLSTAGVAALPFSSGVSAQLAPAIPSTNVAAIPATIFFLRLMTILFERESLNGTELAAPNGTTREGGQSLELLRGESSRDRKSAMTRLCLVKLV